MVKKKKFHKLLAISSGSLLLLRDSPIIWYSKNCKVSIGEIKQGPIGFNFPHNLIFWNYFKTRVLALGNGHSRFLGHCSKYRDICCLGSWETAGGGLGFLQGVVHSWGASLDLGCIGNATGLCKKVSLYPWHLKAQFCLEERDEGKSYWKENLV